jgi:hypothetical protein
MPSNQQKAQENVTKLEQWIKERDRLGDYVDYENTGKVNRKSLCAELDFARSVTNQNPAVKALLSEAEARWYGVRQEDDKKALKAASERSARKSDMTAAENSRLLDEIGKLKAEVAMLKKQLRRYSAMEEVLSTSGIAPR